MGLVSQGTSARKGGLSGNPFVGILIQNREALKDGFESPEIEDQRGK